MPLFFQFFYSFVPKIEICLKNSFWSKIFKNSHSVTDLAFTAALFSCCCAYCAEPEATESSTVWQLPENWTKTEKLTVVCSACVCSALCCNCADWLSVAFKTTPPAIIWRIFFFCQIDCQLVKYFCLLSTDLSTTWAKHCNKMCTVLQQHLARQLNGTNGYSDSPTHGNPTDQNYARTTR